MRQSSFNLICLAVAVLSGVGMFFLKYYVEGQEKELTRLRRQIITDRKELHLLRADWAMLTDPQHLRELIKEINLKPIQAQQIVNPSDLENGSSLVSSEKEAGKKGVNDV